MAVQFRYDAGWSRRQAAAIAVLAAGLLAWSVAAWLPKAASAEPLPVDAERVAAAHDRVDPNTATAASLRRLHRMGPARIRDLMQYRDEHGPEAFTTARDLANVKGIGPATVAELAPDLALPAGEMPLKSSRPRR